jgi:site-specific DNA-methyltransferase (adenine-specific)
MALALGVKSAASETLLKISVEDGKNVHSTVKPTALMQYLCRLITPPNGIVLDPYMGSGSTGKAALREGFSFVGCELDADYYEIAKARVGS